jgi:hypothetical protein
VSARYELEQVLDAFRQVATTPTYRVLVGG